MQIINDYKPYKTKTNFKILKSFAQTMPDLLA